MKKAILIVCFGTSFLTTLENSIGRLEEEIREVFKEYEVFRSFTSEKIIRKIKNKHNIEVLTPKKILDNLTLEGYEEVLVAPIYIMNGEEFSGLKNLILEYKPLFKEIRIATPLLSINKDINNELFFKKDTNNSYELNKKCKNSKSENYEYIRFIKSLESLIIVNKNTLIIGHGSYISNNNEYKILQKELNSIGFNNAIVGVLEGDLGFSSVLKRIKEKNIKEITIIPLMVFAGSHAKKDMISKDDSWKNKLESEGLKVNFILKGLGEYKEFREIFINKLKEAKTI